MTVQNITSNAVQAAFVPKIGISARKAMDVAMQRKDSFTMNEFGNVGVVDLASLMKVGKGKVTHEDVASILQAKDVKVRTPNAEPARKPQTPLKLKGFKAFLAKVADWLNIPTTGRANRMQNAMEYSFGCAVANMVNLSHLTLSGSGSVPAKAITAEIEKHLSEFFDQTDSFVRGFRLDKASRNAAEVCENQIVSRLFHSLESAHDVESLERILSVAKNWEKQDPPSRVDRIMEKLANMISAHNPADRMENATSGLNKLLGNVAKTLKDMFKTTSSKLKEIEAKSVEAILEMDEFRKAFEFISGKLFDEASFSENLSVDAFTDVANEMDSKMSEAIEKGRKMIEAKLAKESAKRKEDVSSELEKGYGDITKVDIKETNKYVRKLLTNSTLTLDRAKSRDQVNDILRGCPKTEKKQNIADAKKEIKAETKLASARAVNAVNKAIEAFAKARKELKVIRSRVECYEICKLLVEKEKNPPAGVNAEDWAAACRSVSDFISSGFGMEQTDTKHIDLVCNYKGHFLAGLPEETQARLEKLFVHSAFKKGFAGQFELSGISTDSSSFECCRAATSMLCEQLQVNIKELESAYATDEKSTLTDRAIKEKLAEIVKDGIADFGSKIKTGVEQTDENRRTGCFFDFENDWNSGFCWIANDDMEEFVWRLREAIRRADGIIAHESAGTLARNSMERVGLQEKVLQYLQPLVAVFNDARGILAVNALTRLRQNIADIRNSVASDESETSLKDMCDKAEREIQDIDGNNVFGTVEVLEALHEELVKSIQNGGGAGDSGQQRIEDLRRIEAQFAQDLDLLSGYGEYGTGTGIQSIANVHFNKTVRAMSTLAQAYKRAWDLEDLISNSLQSIPDFVNRLSTGRYVNEFKSEWLNPKTGAFSISADKLRTDFSGYTKSVMEYVRTLREGGTALEREKAVEAVRDSLGACCSSFAPLMGLLTDIEVFVRERYDEYDAKGFVERTIVCTDPEFAELYVGMRSAIHNAFAALSEISGGAVRGLEDFTAEDNLLIIARSKVNALGPTATKVDMQLDMVDERNQICIKGSEAFVKRAGENTKKTETLYQTREIYRTEHYEDSTSLSSDMVERGSLSDELFRSMERVFLTLSVAKQNGTLKESVVAQIQNLVVQRVNIRSFNDLKEHLFCTSAELAEVEKHVHLLGELSSYSSKLELFEVRTFGGGAQEKSVIGLNEYFKTANVKDYSVAAINFQEGAVSRVVVKDNYGNEAYCTVKYNPGKQGKGGEIEFTPEPGSLEKKIFGGGGFKAFTVKESYSSRGGENLEFPLKLAERE